MFRYEEGGRELTWYNYGASVQFEAPGVDETLQDHEQSVGRP